MQLVDPKNDKKVYFAKLSLQKRSKIKITGYIQNIYTVGDDTF